MISKFDKHKLLYLFTLSLLLSCVIFLINDTRYTNHQYKPETDQVNQKYLDRKIEISRIDQNKKEVVLTFDWGGGNNSVQKVLDTLNQNNTKAVFFITGKVIEKNPELVKEIQRNGHQIYNHTYNHKDLTGLKDEEIILELNKTDELLQKTVGSSSKPFFRAPYGKRNKRVIEIADSLGYQSVYWTVDAQDWREQQGISEEMVIKNIINNLKPGTIYLMHLGDNITGNILDRVIKKIKNEGYSIVQLK